LIAPEDFDEVRQHIASVFADGAMRRFADLLGQRGCLDLDLHKGVD
jgi:hypothetical protein